MGRGVYKIIGLPDEEFPQLPSVEGEALKIGGEILRDVLQKTEFAASTEEVRLLPEWTSISIFWSMAQR